MAYDVTALPNYVEEHKAELAALMVATPKEFDIFSGLSGVVGATALPNLTSEIVFQNGKNCGFNAQGDDVISERVMNPAVIKINKTFCPQDLIGKYAEHQVKVGAGKEELPFEEVLINNIVNKTAAEVSKAFWQGDKENGTGNLAFNDGIYTQVKAEKTAVASGASIKESIENLIAALGENVTNDAIFMPKTMFVKLAQELMNANLYHYDPKVDGFSFYYPATPVMVYGVDGLEGANVAIALNPNNTFYGYNEKDDATTLKVWYSDDDDIFKMKARFVVGAKYRFPEEVEFVELGGTPTPGGELITITPLVLVDGEFVNQNPFTGKYGIVNKGESVTINTDSSITIRGAVYDFAGWVDANNQTLSTDTEVTVTFNENAIVIAEYENRNLPG